MLAAHRVLKSAVACPRVAEYPWLWHAPLSSKTRDNLRTPAGAAWCVQRRVDWSPRPRSRRLFCRGDAWAWVKRFYSLVLQNLGILIGGKDNENQTTATHTIAASTAITTKIRSPFDMGESCWRFLSRPASLKAKPDGLYQRILCAGLREF